MAGKKQILVFQDKLGITAGYESIWNSLLIGARIDGHNFKRFSSYNSPIGKLHLLIKKKNRKTPGFNPDIVGKVRQWFETHCDGNKPDAVLVMDPALFGLFESEWDSATTDKMRGGVYYYKTSAGNKFPVVITTPISAVHRRMDPKEIAILNQGVYSEAEFYELQAQRKALSDAEEDDSESEDDEETSEGSEEESKEPEEEKDDEEFHEEFFMPPYKIPYGRFVLRTDLGKLKRAAEGNLRRPPRFEYHLVNDVVDAEEAVETLSRCILIAADTETSPLNRNKPIAHVTCVGYAGLKTNGAIVCFVFPIFLGKSAHADLHPCAESFISAIRRINQLPIRFTFQNGPYDSAYFLRDGLPIENWAYDSMTMFWAIWPELPKRLDFITSVLSDSYQYWKEGIRSKDINEYWLYNAKDCYTTLYNTLLLAELLNKSQKARRNFFEAHARVAVGFAMSMRGVKSDETALEIHAEALDKKKIEAEKRLKFLVADDEFNNNSAPQKKFLLYTLMGMPFRNAKGKAVKTLDKASTGSNVLRMAQHESPIARIVIKAMQAVSEPSKQISNVIKIKRREVADGKKRTFTAYDGVGTTTTRYSSRKSAFYDGANLQNIRKGYRDFMMADEDSFLLDIDFSAADDVYVTYESGDPKKIDLFVSGRDAHAENATLFFDNWTYDQVVAGKKAKDDRVVHPITGIRQITKKLSHGCNYLMAALTLLVTSGRDAIVAAAKELGHDNAGTWSQAELVKFCAILESKYRHHYVRFRREGGWYDDVRRELIDSGGVLTAFNYFQRFLGDPHSDDVLRAAAATFGQANTAGRINDTVMELELGFIRKEFRDGPNPAFGEEPLITGRRDFGTSLRLQTHDSLTFNVSLKHPHWVEGCQRIAKVMARPTVIRNKLTGSLESFAVRREAEVGIRWGNSMIEWDMNIESLEKTLIKAQEKENAIRKAQQDFLSNKDRLIIA